MRTGNSSFVSCLFVSLPTVCSLKLWRSFSPERRKRKINENSWCNSRRYLSTWQSRTNWKFFRSFCSTYWDLQSSAWKTVKVIHRAGPLKAIALTSQCDRCPLLRPTILWFPSNLPCPSSEVFEFFWAPPSKSVRSPPISFAFMTSDRSACEYSLPVTLLMLGMGRSARTGDGANREFGGSS